MPPDMAEEYLASNRRGHSQGPQQVRTRLGAPLLTLLALATKQGKGTSWLQVSSKSLSTQMLMVMTAKGCTQAECLPTKGSKQSRQCPTHSHLTPS